MLVAAPVAAAGIYLLGLGVAAFLRPAQVTSYLGGFAETFRAHLAELSIRILGGAALIVSASGMQFPGAFRVLGWVLVGTSVLLLVLPWRWHRRFARWSVPQATANLPLLGTGSIVGGVVVLWALWGGGA